MKPAFKLFVIVALAEFSCGAALAQARADAVVSERGPHHAIWEWQTEALWPEGEKKTESHSVVELASGLNYFKDGQWLESKEEIELFNGAGVARQGQFQVIFGANLNEIGAIDLQTPDGKRFRSRVLGLSYFDCVSGQSVLFAETKDAQGNVLPPNQVLYLDAFDGVQADVRYTYRKGSFEQDVIFRENPPPPSAFGLPDESSRLEVWTEFFDPPEATKQAVALKVEPDALRRGLMAVPDLVDHTLDFGVAQIGPGLAFSLSDEPDAEDSIRVVKDWIRVPERGGPDRTFLIEAVEVPALQPLLGKLPAAAAIANPNVQGLAARKNRADSRESLLALARPLKRGEPKAEATAKMQMARLERSPQLAALKSRQGVVLDYTTLNTSKTNQVFAADVTYYISGAVNLYGTNNIIEGGTVIKFAQSAGATLAVKGVLKTDTDLYRPAVLTASKDNTVGETVSSGTPSGGYATTALDFDYATSGQLASITNIRILYAVTGIRFNTGSGHEVRHVQFVNCGAGVKADSANYSIRNALGWSLTNALTGSGSSTGVWEHATFNSVTTLVSTVTGRFTNCLLTAVVTTNGLNGTSNAVSASASGIYKVVGGGNHYLADGSPYRDSGTTNLNPTLANELNIRTTYAPIALGNIVADTTLAPQAGRDTSNPDLGWHYPPLDYWASGVTVSSNVTAWATNGVAVGLDLATNSWAFILQNARLVSVGDAVNYNRLVRAHTAQEKSGGNSGTRACIYDGSSSSGSRESALRWRFTEFTQLANDGYMLYVGTRFGAIEWTHSRIYNPTLVIDTSGSGTLVCGLTNTLWERGGVQIGTSTTGASVTTHLRNNLVRYVSWHFVAGTTNWTVRDNLFDSMAYLGDHSSTVNNWTNAYFNTTYGLAGGVGNISLGSLTYQTNTLGRFYQPTNSTLLNAGSRTADLASLYHFTTTTNQVKETNSIVDIGLHYVAVNASGIPIDSDSDGVGDYLEDANGNGSLDSGETKTNDASDWGLKVLITRPRNKSNIP